MRRLVILFTLLLAVSATALDVPQVSADLGACSAEFKVMDASGKPVYNAPVHVVVRYGFMAKRRTDLTVGTDAQGRARVGGLPSEVKRPLYFEIGTGETQQIINHDPATNCHAHYDVKLVPPQP